MLFRSHELVPCSLGAPYLRVRIVVTGGGATYHVFRTDVHFAGGMEVSIQWIGVFNDKRMKLSKSKVY